ncbi:hypothetical protein ACCS75_34980, partial [Rhizobium ruizarguesonis]
MAVSSLMLRRRYAGAPEFALKQPFTRGSSSDACYLKRSAGARVSEAASNPGYELAGRIARKRMVP